MRSSTYAEVNLDKSQADIDTQPGYSTVALSSQETGNHAASVLIDRRDAPYSYSSLKRDHKPSQPFSLPIEGWQTEWQDLRHMQSVEIAQQAVFGFAEGDNVNRFSFGKEEDAQEDEDRHPFPGVRAASESEATGVPYPSCSETKEAQSGVRSRRPRTQSLMARMRCYKNIAAKLAADSVSEVNVHSLVKPPLASRQRNRIRLKSFSHRKEHSDLFSWSRRSSAPLVLGLRLQRSQDQDEQVEQPEHSKARIVAQKPLKESQSPICVLGLSSGPSCSTAGRQLAGVGTSSSTQTSFSSLTPSVPPAPLPPPRQPRRPSDKIETAPSQVRSGPQDLEVAVSLNEESRRDASFHSQQGPIARRQLPGITSVTFPLSPMSEEGSVSLLSRSTEVICDQHLSPLMPTGMVTASSPPSTWMHSSHERSARSHEYDRIKRSPLKSSIEPSLSPHDVEHAPYADTGVQASLATLRALESHGKDPKTILARQRILGESTVSRSGTLRDLLNLSSGLHLETDDCVAEGLDVEAVQLRSASHVAHLEELTLAQKEMLLFESSLNHGRDLSGATFIYIDDTSKQEKEIDGVMQSTRSASSSSTSSKRKTRQAKQGYGIPDIFTWQAGLRSGIHEARVCSAASAASTR